MSIRRPTDVPVHAPHENPYRASLIDRLGPDADRVMKATAFGIVMGAVFLVLVGTSDATGVVLAACGIAAVAGGVAAGRGLLWFSDVAGAGFLSFIQPSGTSTPYERDYSLQEAMAISGDVDGAIASYVALIDGEPGDVEARAAAHALTAVARIKREG